MASSFSYYRPRGISGCYIVEIVLDLADTEKGEVWVARNRDHPCGHCGKQTPLPIEVIPQNGTKQCAHYFISNFVVGDTITIKIKDTSVVPIQETRHSATMAGFYHELVPFKLNGITWDDVYLNPIYLVDMDCSDKWFDKVPREPQPQLPSPNHFLVRDVADRRFLNERN